MTRVHLAVALLGCVLVSSSARADLHSGIGSEPTATRLRIGHTSHGMDLGASLAGGRTGGMRESWDHSRGQLGSLAGRRPSGIAIPVGPVGTEAGEIREMPHVPGSAQLFLSALLSMGAWQVVRSVKNVRLGQVPEWFHPGGPDQIGHAVAYDFDLHTLPLCCYERQVTEPPIPYHICGASRMPIAPGAIPLDVAPRGPPQPP